MNGNDQVQAITTSNDNSKNNFWNSSKFWIMLSIFLFIFGTFFFTSLGAYTKRDVGVFTASAMGETFFASGTTDWFLIVNNIFIGLMILTPFLLIIFSKFIKKMKIDKDNWKILRNGYFLIFAYTIVIFTFEAVFLIAFANDYLGLQVDLSDTSMTNFSPEKVHFSFLSKSQINLTFAIVYLAGVFLLFSLTIYFLFFGKRYEKFHKYESVFRLTATILLGITMFQLMISVFGAGSIGINAKFYQVRIIDFDGTQYNSLADWWNAGGAVLHGALKDYKDFIQGYFSNKNSFWGVNNNWAGYLIFSLLLFGTFYAIYYLLINIIRVRKDKYEEDKNLFEALIAFTLVVFGFYFFDRYIIVFVDHGNWNPNLFNGLIYQTAKADYYGTVYFWIMMILFPTVSLGTLFYVYKPTRQYIGAKLSFIKEFLKSKIIKKEKLKSKE